MRPEWYVARKSGATAYVAKPYFNDLQEGLQKAQKYV